MSQKPLGQTALSRRAATREAVWPIIRAFNGEQFVFKKLLQQTDMHESSVREYLNLLIKAGFIERDGYSYRLIKDNGREAPRINKAGEIVVESSKSEAIWRSARILGEFDELDIQTALTGLDVPASLAYIKDYLANLARAHYISVVKKGRSGRKTRYRFIQMRYTGPKPPKIQRNSAVFDANIKQIVWQSGFVDLDDGSNV